MKYLIVFFCALVNIARAQSWNTPTIISSSQLHAQTMNRVAVTNDSLNKEKFKRHLQLAGTGSAKDINAVGMCYFLGQGITADDAAALTWFRKAAENGYAKAWYNLGMMYKYGKGTDVDYAKAYECYSRAADANDPSGWYAQGYMLYKGLGCVQNYTQAYALFRRGAAIGRPSCMYFTGLCLRNGYGVEKNTDSARYWLLRAAKRKYAFANDELAAKDPENNTSGSEMARRIKTLQSASAPQNLVLNQFQQIPKSIPAKDIEGTYTGYVIKYDYSGKYIVQEAPVSVTVNYNADSNRLTGLWSENESSSVLLNAILTKNALVFSKMHYDQTDHYNPIVPKRHNFESADLQYLKKGDSVYLLGNMRQYLPDSKEPDKPIFIVVSKAVDTKNNDLKRILFADGDKSIGKMKAYPNPFESYFMVDFDLKDASQVQIQLFTQQGNLVYTNRAGKLEPGSYRLPVKTFLPAGTYVIKLQYGSKSESTTIIKL
jgi:uncharacterized protein